MAARVQARKSAPRKRAVKRSAPVRKQPAMRARPLVAFARGMRRDEDFLRTVFEVARIGITVNAVCPGYVDTEALRSMGEEERKAAVARIPMRRFGKPEEVASAIRFLACPEAGYITGSCLKLDGGIL